jgi:dipeptide transport system ATP-binding protein
MSVLLEVKKISKSYSLKAGVLGSCTVRTLSDVSFELESGQILAVVGESGSGKSTLARQLVKLEQPEEGEIFLEGKSYADIPDLQKRTRMIFQNPAASLNPRKRVFQQLQEPLGNLTDISGSRQSDLIYDCLQRVGLSKSQAQFYPHMLSGGQRQRIAIARAIIVNPQVIVADEAVSALDVSVQGQILNLILDLRNDLGMSWLFISHDISVVKLIADTVLVLFAGRVMESGPANQVLESPLHPYTQKLLQSVPGQALSNLEQGKNDRVPADLGLISQDELVTGSACVYLTRCPIADNRCSKTLPPMATLGKRAVACLKAED